MHGSGAGAAFPLPPDLGFPGSTQTPATTWEQGLPVPELRQAGWGCLLCLPAFPIGAVSGDILGAGWAGFFCLPAILPPSVPSLGQLPSNLVWVGGGWEGDRMNTLTLGQDPRPSLPPVPLCPATCLTSHAFPSSFLLPLPCQDSLPLTACNASTHLYANLPHLLPCSSNLVTSNIWTGQTCLTFYYLACLSLLLLLLLACLALYGFVGF